MRRRLLTLLASLGLATGLFVAIAPLTPVEASCGQAQIIYYEDSYYGGRSQTDCYPTSRGDLSIVPTISNCNRFGPGTNWNDCISSFKITVQNCHYGIGLFVDAGFSGLWGQYWSNRNDAYMGPVGIGSDIISSIKMSYRSVCPQTPTTP